MLTSSPIQVPLTESHRNFIRNCGFVLNDRVIVNETQGEIKYIGPVYTKQRVSRGIYVGIQLHQSKGKNDGTFEGIRYFSCPPNHGLFVRTKSLRLIHDPPSVDNISKLKCPSILTNGFLESPLEQKVFQFWNAMDQFEESEALNTSKEIDLVDQEMFKQLNSQECQITHLYPEKQIESTVSTMWTQTPSFQSTISSGSLLSSTSRKSSLMNRQASCLTTDDILIESVDINYRGPHLYGTPDFAFAHALVDHYRENPGIHLHRKYAINMMIQLVELLKKQVTGSIYYFDIPKKPDAQLIVVGDVHGQLNDVLWLFYKFGTPSANRTYLFNGDIADRGANATEIFFMLFAFQLAYPDSVIINRGNHENADMNEIYGFAQEVRSKYGNVVYQKFQEIFDLLPLCIVIEKRVLVVHGGLFREDGVTLDDINKLSRKRLCPSNPETFEDRLMFDLLWSDPRNEPGRGPSGRGADCMAFGPDITERFLSENQLDVCIRSHQVPTTLRGFEPVHEGRCVTLFSASNYCGTSGNYGGVIIFLPQLSFEIQEYMAPAMSEVREVYNETKLATAKVAKSKVVANAENRAQRRTRRDSVANMKRDVIIKMSRLVCEKKDSIWDSFWKKDVKKQGMLTSADIKECLNISATQFDFAIPWDLLLKKMKAVDSDGFVNYEDFLRRFRVEFRPKGAKHSNWRMETIQRVFESIMKADLNLKETIMIFDRNSDGTVSYREFYELLNELDLGLSEPQVQLLMRIITAHYLTPTEEGQGRDDPVGRVDVAEFLGRFKVIYSHSIKDRISEEDPWIAKALAAIGRAILADKAEAAQRHYANFETVPLPFENPTSSVRRRSSALRSAALFQKFKDFARSEVDAGFLSYKGCIAAIRQLPLHSIEQELGFTLDEDRMIRLARAIDITESGNINYLEFLNAFHVVDSNATTNVAEEMWQQLCAKFYQQKVSLRHALSHFDPNAIGKVDPVDFRAALATLNTVLGPKEAPLTSEQVDLVVTSIDTDEDGTINYEEFLESFVVVDILTSGRGNSNDGQLSRSSSSDTTITCEAVLGMVRSHASSIDESDSDTIKEQLDKHDSIDSIDSIESVDREMDINEGETVSNIPEVRQTHPGHTSENGLRVFEFECHTIPEDGYEQSPRLE